MQLQTEKDFEILIVDNASTDGSVDAIRSNIPTRIFKLRNNIGFAAASNFGIDKAESNWVITLNPDAYPSPTWLEQLLKAKYENPDYAAFGSLLLNAEDPSQIDSAGDFYHISGKAYRSFQGKDLEDYDLADTGIFAPCAAAAMYHKKTLIENGGFDNRFFCYGEDYDLGFRLNLAGHRSMQVNSAVVMHESSNISGKNRSFTTYYGRRNNVWAYVKNMPLPLLLLTIVPHIVLCLILLIKDTFRGQFVASIKGFFHAIWNIRPVLKARKAIQIHRKTTNRQLLKMITLSPLKLANKYA